MARAIRRVTGGIRGGPPAFKTEPGPPPFRPSARRRGARADPPTSLSPARLCPRKVLIEVPEAAPLGVQLLVQIPASTRHLVYGFSSNCFRELRVRTDSADAI